MVRERHSSPHFAGGVERPGGGYAQLGHQLGRIARSNQPGCSLGLPELRVACLAD